MGFTESSVGLTQLEDLDVTPEKTRPPPIQTSPAKRSRKRRRHSTEGYVAESTEVFGGVSDHALVLKALRASCRALGLPIGSSVSQLAEQVIAAAPPSPPSLRNVVYPSAETCARSRSRITSKSRPSAERVCGLGDGVVAPARAICGEGACGWVSPTGATKKEKRDASHTRRRGPSDDAQQPRSSSAGRQRCDTDDALLTKPTAALQRLTQVGRACHATSKSTIQRRPARNVQEELSLPGSQSSSIISQPARGRALDDMITNAVRKSAERKPERTISERLRSASRDCKREDRGPACAPQAKMQVSVRTTTKHAMRKPARSVAGDVEFFTPAPLRRRLRSKSPDPCRVAGQRLHDWMTAARVYATVSRSTSV